MVAKCGECGLGWNISIKAEIPKKGYKCPECRAKDAVKATQHKKSNVRVSKVLLNNKSKFTSV